MRKLTIIFISVACAILILLCIVLLIVYVVIRNDDGLFEVNIIHHNDFHARFVETGPTSGVCDEPTEDGGTSCIGGFARLVTAATDKLAAKPDSLILDAGDVFQGTLWYNILRWNVTQFFLNLVPHDAHVLGNHEFDHGIEGVVPFMEHVRGPVVLCNIDDSEEPTFQDKYSKSTVVERNGRKIGIIGVILADTPNLAQTRNLRFLDEVESVTAEAARLTAEGINIIIVLSHCGLDLDRHIARKSGAHIDLIVGGHSHTLLFTGDTPNGDIPEADYPVVEINEATGREVLIVQASAFTKYLGEITLLFDRDGVLQKWEGHPMFMDNSVIQDPVIMELLAPYKEEVDMIGKQEIGSSQVQLSRFVCGYAECNLGSFICDAFVDSTVENAPEGHWAEAAICIINQGGIRAAVNRGTVTLESLVMSTPFENSVDTFDLKGRYILEAFEFSLSQSWNQLDQPFFGGNMLQTSGIRGTYNISQPIGKRVVELLIRCAKCDVPVYEPLDLEKTYRIVSQSFIRAGGDNFHMISNNLENLEVGDTDIDILQNYVSKQSPIMQSLDGRITLHDPLR